MPNQAESLRSVQPNGLGNSPSLAGARATSAVTSVQPFRAPIPDATATAATSLPAQAPWVKIAWKAGTNGAPLPTSARCGTRPITAAATSRYTTALAAVPSREARPAFLRGFLTRLALIAPPPTPTNQNIATPPPTPI